MKAKYQTASPPAQEQSASVPARPTETAQRHDEIAHVAAEFVGMCRMVANSRHACEDIAGKGDNAVLYLGFSFGVAMELIRRAGVPDDVKKDVLFKFLVVSSDKRSAERACDSLPTLLNEPSFVNALKVGTEAADHLKSPTGFASAGKLLAGVLN